MSQENESNLDKQVEAFCECGAKRTVTFRNLKNRWPICARCKQPMKVKGNAVPPISTTD